MHFVVIAVTLYLFWLLLSGYYTALLLGLGGLSALLVVWMLLGLPLGPGAALYL